MKNSSFATADGIETSPDGLSIIIGEDRYQVPWSECSLLLAEATESNRLNAEMSPSGYGIHWPTLDEDLSVGGLLANRSPD
jgi:hypothetical protein